MPQSVCRTYAFVSLITAHGPSNSFLSRSYIYHSQLIVNSPGFTKYKLLRSSLTICLLLSVMAQENSTEVTTQSNKITVYRSMENLERLAFFNKEDDDIYHPRYKEESEMTCSEQFVHEELIQLLKEFKKKICVSTIFVPKFLLANIPVEIVDCAQYQLCGLRGVHLIVILMDSGGNEEKIGEIKFERKIVQVTEITLKFKKQKMIHLFPRCIRSFLGIDLLFLGEDYDLTMKDIYRTYYDSE